MSVCLFVCLFVKWLRKGNTGGYSGAAKHLHTGGQEKGTQQPPTVLLNHLCGCPFWSVLGNQILIWARLASFTPSDTLGYLLFVEGGSAQQLGVVFGSALAMRC
jgi:hypothetical protein